MSIDHWYTVRCVWDSIEAINIGEVLSGRMPGVDAMGDPVRKEVLEKMTLGSGHRQDRAALLTRVTDSIFAISTAAESCNAFLVSDWFTLPESLLDSIAEEDGVLEQLKEVFFRHEHINIFQCAIDGSHNLPVIFHLPKRMLRIASHRRFGKYLVPRPSFLWSTTTLLQALAGTPSLPISGNRFWLRYAAVSIIADLGPKRLPKWRPK